jgi:signal transduction histidine kinase
MKSEFLSIVSHQLRTPLTAMKGYISMMKEATYGKPPARMEKPLQNIYSSSDRLIRLVNNLLKISAIESGKIEMNPQKSSLEEIIASLIEELKHEANEKKLLLKFEKPAKPLPEMIIDRDEIRQAILNIVDNAIKYTNSGGVTVKLERTDSKARITVADTGEGMSAEEIKKIFESFSRGPTGTKFWAEGSGLGLYTAKKFAEMHDGRIWAESKGKGKGSTFYIELPIK